MCLKPEEAIAAGKEMSKGKALKDFRISFIDFPDVSNSIDRNL